MLWWAELGARQELQAGAAEAAFKALVHLTGARMLNPVQRGFTSVGCCHHQPSSLPAGTTSPRTDPADQGTPVPPQSCSPSSTAN